MVFVEDSDIHIEIGWFQAVGDAAGMQLSFKRLDLHAS